MATAEDYAKWIVENADQKGSDDFNTVARAYQEAKDEEIAPFKLVGKDIHIAVRSPQPDKIEKMTEYLEWLKQFLNKIDVELFNKIKKSTKSKLLQNTNNMSDLMKKYINEIRNGLLKVIDDDNFRSNLINNGFLNAKQFAIEKITEQYSKLYKSLLN